MKTGMVDFNVIGKQGIDGQGNIKSEYLAKGINLANNTIQGTLYEDRPDEDYDEQVYAALSNYINESNSFSSIIYYDGKIICSNAKGGDNGYGILEVYDADTLEFLFDSGEITTSATDFGSTMKLDRTTNYLFVVERYGNNNAGALYRFDLSSGLDETTFSTYTKYPESLSGIVQSGLYLEANNGYIAVAGHTSGLTAIDIYSGTNIVEGAIDLSSYGTQVVSLYIYNTYLFVSMYNLVDSIYNPVLVVINLTTNAIINSANLDTYRFISYGMAIIDYTMYMPMVTIQGGDISMYVYNFADDNSLETYDFSTADNLLNIGLSGISGVAFGMRNINNNMVLQLYYYISSTERYVRWYVINLDTLSIKELDSSDINDTYGIIATRIFFYSDITDDYIYTSIYDFSDSSNIYIAALVKLKKVFSLK